MDYQARRQQQAQATHRAILEAASELFRTQGFDQVTIRDICQQAGVTTGAFYHHFKSKDDLLNQGFSSLDAYLETALAPYRDSPPLERLGALLGNYTTYMQEQGWETVARYYTRRLSDPRTESMSPQRFTLRTMQECLTALARDGSLSPKYTPEWTAEFFFRHFRGVVIDWILHRGTFPLQSKLAQDYQLFAAVFSNTPLPAEG